MIKRTYRCTSINMNNDQPLVSIQEFPTEVLFHIFLYSSPKELGFCSRVCTRWKEIIDSVIENEKYWYQHCMKDFGDLAKSAYDKSQCGTTWRRIYRSLTLWPQLLHAQESRDEFAITTNEGEEVYGFQVLQKGVVGVHKQNSIVYYYIKDLQPVDVPKVTGCYLKYVENEDTMVFHSLYFHMFIVRKYVTERHFQHNITFDDVKLFKLINRSVYFVKLDDELCVCDLNDSKFSCAALCTIPNGTLNIAVRENNIHILTKMCNIYVYEMNNRKLYIVENLKNVFNPFSILRKYRFLDETDQHAYFPWMNYKVFVSIPNKLTADITSIKTYGDIVFVGTKYGVFRIYHITATEDLSFFDKKPLKEYNFMNNADLSVRIHQIDVVEGDDQHTVLVALENKIISLTFAHKFR